MDESADASATCVMITAVSLLERDMSDNKIACGRRQASLCIYTSVKSM